MDVQWLWCLNYRSCDKWDPERLFYNHVFTKNNCWKIIERPEATKNDRKLVNKSWYSRINNKWRTGFQYTVIEEGITAAHERKHLKYSKLAAEHQEAGWKAKVYPVEVGCRGFVSKAVVQLFRGADGMTRSNLRKAVKELGECNISYNIL